MRKKKSYVEKLRQQAYIIIYGTNTVSGRLFDLFLLGVIVLSVILVMLETVEGFDDEIMEKVKQNFLKHNAFQCGFCSPGMLMTTKEILLNKKKLTRDEIRSEISGNYCRCTGYQSIVDAIEECINEIN